LRTWTRRTRVAAGGSDLSAGALNVPGMYHPFRHLRSLDRLVTFSIEPTPGNKPAWWSPASEHILMRPGLMQVERRCHLAHELAHRDLNHSGQCEYDDATRQTRRQERRADELAARRLIGLDAFINVLCWTDDHEEAADGLWVTPHMLSVRMEAMYGGERMRIASELRRRLAE
jgi:hypothetical protein